MTKKPTGYLYWRKSGWRARIKMEVDGEWIRQTFDLKTDNKAAARVKLKRLLEQHAPSETEAVRVETFREAAERVVDASSIGTKEARLTRLRSHVFGCIGNIPVDKLRAADVSEVLKSAADCGQSKQSIQHLRNDISSVLSELWRDEMIAENVASKARIPKSAKVDTRERAVLSDEELIVYLGWEHPAKAYRVATLERQTMACVSRMFGGLRLGDIRTIRWEAFDIDGGNFPTGWAPRRKTKRPQLLEVPEMLRPILRDWWERAGRPAEGLMFPVRKGATAGQERKPSSPAKALRRDLARAMGLQVPVRTPIKRRNGRDDVRVTWAEGRKPNPRERELLEETEFTRPVDFHSFRRAFKQALADAGVELTQAMALSGATDVKAHQRYLANTSKMRQLPAAALPNLATRVSHNDDSHAHLESHPANDCDENGLKTASVGALSQIHKRGVVGSSPTFGTSWWGTPSAAQVAARLSAWSRSSSKSSGSSMPTDRRTKLSRMPSWSRSSVLSS